MRFISIARAQPPMWNITRRRELSARHCNLGDDNGLRQRRPALAVRRANSDHHSLGAVLASLKRSTRLITQTSKRRDRSPGCGRGFLYVREEQGGLALF